MQDSAAQLRMNVKKKKAAAAARSAFIKISIWTCQHFSGGALQQCHLAPERMRRQRGGSGGKCLPTPSDSGRTGLAAPALTHTRGRALTARPWPLTRGRPHQQRLHSTIAPSERPQRSQPAAEEEEGAKQGGNRGGGVGGGGGGGLEWRWETR